MKDVLFHPEAEEEMMASSLFYETRIKGLGYKFLNEIERSLKLISASPGGVQGRQTGNSIV